MRGLNIFMACLAILLAFTAVILGGCAAYTVSAPTQPLTEEETCVRTEEESTAEIQTKVKYIYETRYVEPEYIAAEEREKWREGLERLLSNVITPVYVTGGELIGYVATYPDRPAIEPLCFAIALFDIDLDGTPEVLGNAGGGSSGNCFYYVHDLESGEYIGALHGGHDGTWAVYLDREEGDLEVMCEYGLRCGWPSQSYHVSRATLAENVFGMEKTVYETSYLKVLYDEQAVEVPLTEEQKEAGIGLSYDTAYVAVDFSVDGENAGPAHYYEEYGYFADNYLRIEGSGIKSIYWTDVADGIEDPEERARLMADALIGSEQKFVIGIKE